MAHNTATGTQHTYKAHERDTLLSEVSTVQLILLPRALAIAGFSESGEVLMMHYTHAAGNHVDWGCEFFEHQFINEPLLGVPQQVKALFVGSPYQMIIPDALYDEKITRSWLGSLFPIQKSDWITEYHGESDAIQYRMAMPHELHKLLTRYFGHTAVLPLAASQFYKPDAARPHLVQCLITDQLVFATLRDHGKLQWHKVFEYSTPEDIAWQLAHICKQLHVRLIELRIEATTLCDTCYNQVLELETFFPRDKVVGSYPPRRWTLGAGDMGYATALRMRIIGGTHGGRRYNPPNGLPARPTTDLAREALFNILQNSISLEGIEALELFGGTGGVTYELASRGAASVTIIEQHAGSVAYIKKMLAEFSMEDVVQVVKGDVFIFLKTHTKQYDLIFADPPYALAQLALLPEIVFEKGLLLDDGLFVLEHDGKHTFEGKPHFQRVKKYGDTYFSLGSTLL